MDTRGLELVQTLAPEEVQFDGGSMSQQGLRSFRRRASRHEASDTIATSSTGTFLAPFRSPPPPYAPENDVWDNLPIMRAGIRKHFLARAPLISFFRNDPAARAFDLLRTRLLQVLKANNWSRIAIAGPTSGCGATFTAVNLALSLARIPGSRTVLMDLNNRNPGVADALDIHGVGDMHGFLTGQVSASEQFVRTGPTLAVGLTETPDIDASEMLHDARCAEALDRMSETLQPDVTLFDLPAVLEHDDLAAFMPQVDGVLLVSDATKTLAEEIKTCEKILGDQTRVLGVVLNRARARDLDFGAAS